MKKENIKKTDEEKKNEDVLEPNYKTENKSNKKVVIALICVSIVFFLIIIFSTIFALLNLNNMNIISGVKVNGIEISNLSKEEANKKLQEEINKKLEGDIVVKAKEFEYGIKLSQVETNYNIEKALEQAYNIGRSGNIFTNNYDIIKCIILGREIDLEYTYNEELLDKLLSDICSKIPNSVVEPSYYIEDDKLIITRGKKGVSIDEEKVKEEIVNKILNNDKNFQINADLIEKEPLPIDIDKIYEEVHIEPKDAYYKKEPFEIFSHVNGVDFDLERARELLKEEKEDYEIELIITIPDVTTNEIGTEAFPDLLASFSTRYDASNYPRTTNLKLAMGKLNEVIVASGETFSYNKTLGKRTEEAGYKYAGGYAAGGVVQTLAGGICQISSTLYDAVVYANLDIVERHNHMFLAGYVEAGKDATVVYGSLDFKFKNTRKYPIMIKTSIGNGVAKVEIYGIKEEAEYDVDIVTSVLSYTPFKVVYEEDSSLAPGEEKVSQNGMNGCKSITHKIVKLNGVEVSREVLSSDTYEPMNKIIKKGPEKVVETSSNETEETKEPIVSDTNKNEEKEQTQNKTENQTPKPNSGTTQKPNTNSTQKPSTSQTQKPSTSQTQKPSTTTTNKGESSEEELESEKEDKKDTNESEEKEKAEGEEKIDPNETSSEVDV